MIPKTHFTKQGTFVMSTCGC